MTLFSSKKSRNERIPWQELFFVAGSIGSMIGIAAWMWWNSGGGSENGDGKDDFDKDDCPDIAKTRDYEDVPAAFPWEPQGSVPQRPTAAVKHSPKASSVQELDFLASMTFANGGIRAPSCYCCV